MHIKGPRFLLPRFLFLLALARGSPEYEPNSEKHSMGSQSTSGGESTIQQDQTESPGAMYTKLHQRTLLKTTIQEAELGYEETAKSIAPGVDQAKQVISAGIAAHNSRDSEIPKFFSIGLGFDAVGLVTEAFINPDFNPTTLLWKLKSQALNYVLFAWPHLHPRIFGAGSTHLPCSGEDATHVINRMGEFQPENEGQLAVGIEDFKLELIPAIQCVLEKGARYVEAAEVRSHAAKLFEQYNYMLRLQLPAPPSFPDNSSLAYIDQSLIKYPKILLSLAEQTSSSSRQSISDKNSSILEGVAFGAVALFATWIGLIKSSERHEVYQRSVHSKQQKKDPEDTEWHHTLRLFSKASQMVGSTSVAVAYMAILWVGEESTSQINCGAQEVQVALDAFPLLETPGDIVSVTGDRERARQMVADFNREIKNKLHCIYHRNEAATLRATINAYVTLLYKRVELS